MFGRILAKNIANKYNEKLYKGKNDTALRPDLAAVSGQGRKNGKKGKKDKAQDEATTHEQGKEDTNTVEGRSINSYYTGIIEENHNAILNNLGEFENEMVNDSSSKKYLLIVLARELIRMHLTNN